MSNYLKVNAVSDNVELIAPMKTVFRDGMGYYTPEIDSEGNLTWVPSNNDIPAVSESVNIMGPAGADGKQGKDGAKGETGDSGVYIGTTEPTNGANVWINPEAELVTDYVTKEYVDEKISEIQLEAGSVSSVNGKAGAVVLTAADVGALPADTVIPDTTGFLTEEDLDGLATTEYVDNIVENLELDVDLTGYATEDYVDQAIMDAQLSGGDVDLSNYYTKTETNTEINKAVSAIVIPDTTGFIKADALEPYALKTELPDTTGFITIDALEPYALVDDIPDTTGFITESALQPYALKSEVPSIEGLATEEYVDNAIANIPSSGGGEGGSGAAADEKTIITNSAGKLETVIGGYRTYKDAPIERVNKDVEFILSWTNNFIESDTKFWNGTATWFYSATGPFDVEITIRDVSLGEDIVFRWENQIKEAYSQYISFTENTDVITGLGYNYLLVNKNNTVLENGVDYITNIKVWNSTTYNYFPIGGAYVPVDGKSIIYDSGTDKIKAAVELMGGNGEGSVSTTAQNTSTNFGDYSANFGSYNYVGHSGNNSITCGNQNRITANCTSAFGLSNNVTSANSFAAGNTNAVSGMNCFAAGAENNITMAYSYALGAGLMVNSSYQVALGKYNSQDTASTYGLIFGIGDSTSAQRNGLTINRSGEVAAAGAFTGSGADYAEYFEWLDGNPEAEDRIGYLVTLSGSQIRLAQPGEDVLGVVSGTAMVLGDNAEWNWQGKYLKDDFGRVIYDMVEQFVEQSEYDEEGNVVGTITVSAGFNPVPRINPNYNPEEEYVKRADRPEWETVGLMGKLYVRDDGTCAVGGYAAAGADGIATASTGRTNMRVIERVNNNIIRILMK